MPAPSPKGRIEQVPTGISGLDRLLRGGVPKSSVILVSGSPGTGKSILCTQIIANGCRSNENCLYVALEESIEDIMKQASAFGWPLRKYMDKGLLKILSHDILKDRDVISRVFNMISKYKIDRLVIDSLTSLEHNPSFLFEAERFDVMVTQKKTRFVKHDEWLLRAAMHYLIQRMRENPATVFLTNEILEESTQLSSDGMSEFLCDGIILLHYLSIGAQENRTIEVRKMRFVDHMKGTFNFRIGRKGIVVDTQNVALMK